VCFIARHIASAGGPALPPFAGNYCALGDEAGIGAFYIYQDVSIPSGVAATLSWAHRVRNFYTSFSTNQGFQVRICDTNNHILTTAFTTRPGDTLLGNWVQTNFDMTAFSGKTVRVMFWVDATYFYMDALLDNVSLQASAKLALTPTNTANFVNGVWHGNITLLQPGTNVVLTANDGNGHVGSSNPFNVVSSGTPPFVVSQPLSQTNLVGTSASFSITATGTAPLSYRWSWNGTNIAGATNATLVLSNLQLPQAGNYAVRISNSFGSTNSTVATLTLKVAANTTNVLAGVTLTSRPRLATAAAGGNLQLKWATDSGSFQVQSAPGLSGPWSNVSLPLVTNGTDITVTISNITNNQQYYRLVGQ